MKSFFLVLILFFVSGCFSHLLGKAKKVKLSEVRCWTYVIQDVDKKETYNQLIHSHFDMYVLEPVCTEKGKEKFPIKKLVEEIKKNNELKYNKIPIILAYIDIGQAEDWRWYWQSDWKIGNPSWIISNDPNNWEGCFPVAFWEQQWEDIVINGYKGKSFVEITLQAGFDGIYMDWIEAFSDDNVIEKAKGGNLDSGKQMFDFIAKIKKYAREKSRNKNPQYLIVAQNAPDLFEENQHRYINLLDALAEEGVWYDGESDVDWEDARGYNVPTKTWYPDWSKYVLEILPKIKKYMPVFCIEYAQDVNKQKCGSEIYNDKAPQYGFIPYCSRRSLSKISKTPYPKGYQPKDY